jgi:hypothetical protein
MRARVIVPRIKKLVGMPGCGLRTVFHFTVAHHTTHNEVEDIKNRTVSMQQRVTQFATLVNGTGYIRAGDSARKKLPEPALHALLVQGDIGIHLAVGSFERGVCHQTQTTMTDIDHAEIKPLDSCARK